MSIPLDEVLRALRKYPDGVSTAELAEKLGIPRQRLSNRLGKLYMYGGPVDREVIREPLTSGARRYMKWRAK